MNLTCDDIKKIILSFADEVSLRQIELKIQVNNQVKCNTGVLQAMCFRKEKSPVIRDVLWKGGLVLLNSDTVRFLPTEKQVQTFQVRRANARLLCLV